MDTLVNIALVPVFILLYWIYYKDACEKEPMHMLVKAFFSGCGVAIAIIIFGVILIFLGIESTSEFHSVSDALKTAFLEAAIPEEIGKFLVLYFLIWKSKYFDEHFDGIVYATFVSLGFAALENIFYVFDGGYATGLVRAFTAVPGHFLFGVVMGYYFSLAKFGDIQLRRRNILFAITLPILLHGAYDAILMSIAALGNTGEGEELDAAGIILSLLVAFIALMIGMWRTGLKKVKTLVEQDKVLAEEGRRLVNDAAPVEENIDNIANQNMKRPQAVVLNDISYSSASAHTEENRETDSIPAHETDLPLLKNENIAPISAENDVTSEVK